jgi:hypothetical protein
MTTNVDVLVDRYLTDLDAELHDLPAIRRREILDEVGEHIAAARATLDAETEAAIRTVLERLGDPADIAAEARDRFDVPAQPASQATPWLEAVALVTLVVPFLSVVGVVLVWLSRRWTTRDKLIGTLGGIGWLVAPLGTIGVSAGGTGLGPTEVIVFVVPFVLPIAAAVYLAVRLHGQAVPQAPWLEVATLVALLVPILGWVVGLVLLWLSRTWTTREKAVATLLVLGAGALGLAVSAGPIEWILPLLVIALTIPAVIYLAIRLRTHAGAMPATG